MQTAEDIVNEKQSEIVTIDADQTVLDACRKMDAAKIGAIVVSRGADLVGVWSERDLLRYITVEGFEPQTAKVGDYMNSPIYTAPHNTPIQKLEEMFLGLFVRHLVVEKEGRYIGFISIGDVLRASLLEKDRQFKEINKLASWDYYENWRWGRERKKS